MAGDRGCGSAPSCGGLPDYLSSACRQVLGSRFLHIPYATPLDRLLTTVDVFANPFRAGGGNSANLALGAGAAVLSLRAGDVSALIPDSFVASDPEEYFRYLDFLIESPAFLAAVKAEQFRHNSRMRDQDAFLANLQQMVCLAGERYAARQGGARLSETVFAPEQAPAWYGKSGARPEASPGGSGRARGRDSEGEGEAAIHRIDLSGNPA